MSSHNSEWMDGLKRAVGLKRTFRRTGASALGNIALGAAVGVVSGYYIFAAPLKEYWAEQARMDAAATTAAATVSAHSGTATTATAATTNDGATTTLTSPAKPNK